MRRAAFDDSRNTYGKANEESDKPSPLPCRVCHAETDREILSNHGAMCQGCYADYVRKPLAESPNVGDKAARGEKDWAQAMRKREASGERLTPFQSQAWRYVLKPEYKPEQ